MAGSAGDQTDLYIDKSQIHIQTANITPLISMLIVKYSLIIYCQKERDVIGITCNHCVNMLSNQHHVHRPLGVPHMYI